MNLSLIRKSLIIASLMVSSVYASPALIQSKTIAADIDISSPGTLSAQWTPTKGLSINVPSSQTVGVLSISYTNGNKIGIKESSYNGSLGNFIWKNKKDGKTFSAKAMSGNQSLPSQNGEVVVQGLNESGGNVSVSFVTYDTVNLTPGDYTENMLISLYSV